MKLIESVIMLFISVAFFCVAIGAAVWFARQINLCV